MAGGSGHRGRRSRTAVVAARAHPRAVRRHTVDSMRTLRASVAGRFPQKGHDLTFLRRQALAEMFAAAGYGEGPAADDAFEIFLSERNRVEFYADVLPALTRLRAKYRLFALSNGNADLERCGIAELFDGHITASAAVRPSPTRGYFRICCARPACRASKCCTWATIPWRTWSARRRPACRPYGSIETHEAGRAARAAGAHRNDACGDF